MTSPRFFNIDKARVHVFESRILLGQAAAAEAAQIIRETVAQRGVARIIVATGKSQMETVHALVRTRDIPWNSVQVFHLDEYVGLPATHPASLRFWVKTQLVDRVKPGQVYYMEGDAADLNQECSRYGDLIRSAPMDVGFIGFGENGHIAFNDPHVADFNDPLTVKQVEPDQRSRRQQVGEENFPDIASVPRFALTLTCPAILQAAHLICSVPELRKAEAVKNALQGPLGTECPASIVRTHPGARIYLDDESASLLSL